jgi:hypothetical protein
VNIYEFILWAVRLSSSAAVCGSAAVSVAVRAALCSSARSSAVRQCVAVRQWAAVRQCVAVMYVAVCGSVRGSMRQCVAVCGSARARQCVVACFTCIYTKSLTMYLLVCPLYRGSGNEPHVPRISFQTDQYEL